MTEEMEPTMGEGGEGEESKRRTWIIAGVAAVVVLGCCCCLGGYLAWTYGDVLLQNFNLTGF